MNLLRAAWLFLLLLLHLLVGVWVCLSIRKTRLADGKILPEPEPVTRWSARLMKIMGIQVITHGNAPREPGLIVANHISWVDIPAINMLTGASFLSKNSVRYWPVIGWFATASGTVFIRRGNHETRRVSSAIAERLREERYVAIFPEGSTSDGSEVKHFFPRLFSAAIDSHTAVIPVALRYTCKGKLNQKIPYTKGRSFFLILFNLLARSGNEVHVVFCDPIPSSGRDRRSLAQASHTAIQAALEVLPDS